jgi:hypothetical protein
LFSLVPAPDFSNQLYEGPSLYDGNVLNEIHDSNYDPVPGDYEVLLPTWQNSPVVARLPCYNWDLFSLENVGAVNRTYRAFLPVLGEAYAIPDPTDNELDVVEAKWWSDRFRDYVPFTMNPYEPISNLYYPIIDWDMKGLRTPQIYGPPGYGGPRVVGILVRRQLSRPLCGISHVTFSLLIPFCIPSDR